ncbi:unnamed protein product [Candidula unifasciata]|uniref:G-protein coupled receptors family 2 profile 2 domain-containing protein n=1 Tax=Candidula unifasciata TaxID=100452 RepID=A0A8S3ZFE2_9EUPU|nr:unnamed protein product [Candidula unifasciata]
MWATLDSGIEFLINFAFVFSENIVPLVENLTGPSVNKSRGFYLDCFGADGFILGHNLYSRDEVEASMLRDFILNNVTVDIDANTTVTLMPTLYPHRKQKLINCSTFDSEKSSCISRTFKSDYFHQVSEKDKQGSLIMEPNLNCAFVQFNTTEYLYIKNITTKHESCSITLNFKNARMTLTDRADLNIVSINDDGKMRICLELLNKKELFRSEVISSSFLKLTLYALTLVCMISSIICLTISLMTYFLFPVLRSVAGRNNMFLCGSLLLAQISLLSTSHVQEAGHLCTILAICTHFLWLSMFCWCFTCCFHMFCVFSAKTRSIQSTAKSEMLYMIKRVVACFAIPGLIVTGVIATNLSISGGEFLGYGKSACFVDSQIVLIIALVGPLCLVLLFNFIFFSITVIKIHKVRNLQIREFRKDDHNNLYIYIKLSSMTGIFWVLSVISEATDNDPLRFISIGLNGLHGVFIFLSFICNKSVLKLYLKLLGLET